MLKLKARLFTSRSPVGLVAIILFAAVGTVILIAGHAASTAFSIEAESGDRTVGMSPQKSGMASGGEFIQFRATSPLPLGYGQPDGPSGSWTLKLNDEFDGTSLNTTNWSTGWYGSGVTPPVQSQELACYDPSQVTVDGGLLKLKVIANPVTCNKGTNPHPYRSGAITSVGKREYSYGFFEAKILVDTDNNGSIYNWPAWWMDGTGSWPSTGELDIMEGLGGTANATWHGPENNGSGHNFADMAITPGWHTFAAQWEPGSVTAYYDGVKKKTYASSTNITSSVQFLALMEQVDQVGGHGGTLKVPSEMDVDYVRVWQR